MSEHGGRSTETADTCWAEEVDGEPVRVHGSGGWDDKDREAFAEIVRAAKRRLAEQSSPPGAPS